MNQNAILATTQNTEDVAVATREVQRLMVYYGIYPDPAHLPPSRASRSRRTCSGAASAASLRTHRSDGIRRRPRESPSS